MLRDNDDGNVEAERRDAPRDEGERPKDSENVEACAGDRARPVNTWSGLSTPPDDGRIGMGFPAPGPTASPPAAASVSVPTVLVPVLPMPSPPNPDPLVLDAGGRAKPSDPGAVVAAGSRSGVPDARIKEEWPDGSRAGRIDRDRPPPASRYSVFMVADEWRLHLIPAHLTQAMTLIVEDSGVEVQIAVVSEPVARSVGDLLMGAWDRLVTIPMSRSPVIRARGVDTEKRIRVTVAGVRMMDRPIRSRRTTMHRKVTTGRSI